MKIVLNKCYGVFGLSLLAQKEYLKAKGKEAFFYKLTKFDFEEGISEYKRLDDVESVDSFSINTITKDLGKTISKLPDKEYWYHGDIERTDPDLVAIVERLGKKANGWAAELEIVDIPDGIEYTIEDYDGIETVEEEHRSW